MFRLSVDFLILNAKIFNFFLLKKDDGKYFMCVCIYIYIYVGNYFFYVNDFYQGVGY
jgi:hypothetical protein